MKFPVAIRGTTNNHEAAKALQGPLPFGKVFADLMFQVFHTPEKGWHDAAIVPYGPLPLSPAAKVFHYGQEVFEGLKAYPWPDGKVALFRPEQNARRMIASAEKIALVPMPEDLHLFALHLLVDRLRAWVPRIPDGSLYLRPTLMGVEPTLGVAPSNRHLFLILACPTGGNLFSSGSAGISLWVEPKDVRAFPGGVGSSKTGGNYAASLPALKKAQAAGFEQVLFLDARTHKECEEMNGCNFFLVEDGQLLTPPLGDTILDGITRRSILELAGDLGTQAREERLPIDRVIDGLIAGRVTEMFTSGTGATITSIRRVVFRDRALKVGTGEMGPIASRIKATLEGIQSGQTPDTHQWMKVVEPIPIDANGTAWLPNP